MTESQLSSKSLSPKEAIPNALGLEVEDRKNRKADQDTFAEMDPLSRESASNVAALSQFAQSDSWWKHNPKGGFCSVKLKHQAVLGVLQRQGFKAQGGFVGSLGWWVKQHCWGAVITTVLFISHIHGVWRSEVRTPVWSASGKGPGGRLPVFPTVSGVFFQRTLIPFMTVVPSDLFISPRTSYQNHHTRDWNSGIEISADRKISSVAAGWGSESVVVTKTF